MTTYIPLVASLPFVPPTIASLSFTPPVESTATLLDVIESLRRDRRLAMAQVELALARLAHAQQAGTWQAIDADIEAAKVALREVKVRMS